MEVAFCRICNRQVRTAGFDEFEHVGHILACDECREQAGYRSGPVPVFFHYPHRGLGCPARVDWEGHVDAPQPPAPNVADVFEQRFLELLRFLGLRKPPLWHADEGLESTVAGVLTAAAAPSFDGIVSWLDRQPNRLLRELMTVEFSGILRTLAYWIGDEFHPDLPPAEARAFGIQRGVELLHLPAMRDDALALPDNIRIDRPQVDVGSDEHWFLVGKQPVRTLIIPHGCHVRFTGPLAEQQMVVAIPTRIIHNVLLHRRDAPIGTALVVHGPELTTGAVPPLLYVLPTVPQR